MAMKNQVLVLTDEAVPPVQGMGDLVNGLIPADATTITYCLELEGKLPFQNASLDLAIAVLRSIERFGNRWFEEISRVVKPSGKIVIQTYVPSSHHKKLSSWLERQLLLSGFIELQALQSQSPLPGEGSIAVTIEGNRPSWTIGSSFALKNARNALPKIRNEEAPDFIDEDSLLTDEDYVKPRLPSGSATDCKTTSTRKACKNCTCGRAGAEAEAEERLWLTAEQMSNPQSACGSCGLGDAFRCGGCPYRGLPPFKLGEKVSLPSNFLVTDM